MVDKDAPDELGRKREEVVSITPLHLALIDKAQIRFVDQRGSLKRVAGTFPVQARLREPTQLSVHERR